MLIQKAIEDVQFRLGNRRDLEEKVLNAFTLIQEEVEQSGSPWWYLFQEDVQLTVVANQRTVAYPTRFIQLYDYESMYLLDSSGTRSFLESDVRSLLLAAYPGGGEPQAFFDTTTALELYPLPDAVYDLRADCFIGEPTVRETIQSMGQNAAVNKHFQYAADYFIAMATFRLATSLNNARVAKAATDDLSFCKARLTRRHVVWEENNISRNMGDTR